MGDVECFVVVECVCESDFFCDRFWGLFDNDGVFFEFCVVVVCILDVDGIGVLVVYSMGDLIVILLFCRLGGCVEEIGDFIDVEFWECFFY